MKHRSWLSLLMVLCMIGSAPIILRAADDSDHLDKKLEEDLRALHEEVKQATDTFTSTDTSTSSVANTEATPLAAIPVLAPKSQPVDNQPKANGASAQANADSPIPAEMVPPSAPQHPTLITDVEVRGNSIVGTNTILSKIKSQKGTNLLQETVNEDIKRLYAAGFFEDIKIEVKENVQGYGIVVVVLEKPIIRKISIEGFKSFKEDKLRKELNVSEGQVLDRKAVKQGVEAIRKLYANKGFRFVDVTSDVNIDRATNDTAIVVHISEGEKYKIKSLELQGTKAFKVKQLKKLMKTKSKQSWLLRSGVFKGNDFDEDLERLQLFYQKEGYLDVKVAPDFKYDDKGQRIDITINVEEGSKYVCGDIKIKGNRLFPESEIWQELEMLPGQTYSQYYLSQDLEKIRQYYFTRGYMDARIVPDTQLNKETRKVDVSYTLDEGDLYFVEKVVVRGNTKTRDIVIRRELRIRPGDKFDGQKLEKSKQRLENLGYFEEITYDTEPSPSGTNRKDLIFRVKEKRTGELSFGGGVSSVDNLVGFAEISQKNFDWLNWPRFTGGGQSLSVRGRIGTINQSYNVSFYNPYIFNKPLAYGLDFFNYRENSKSVDFDENRLGATNTISKLFKDVFRLGTGYTLERVKLDHISDDASQAVRDFSGKNWLSRWKIFSNYDTRDNIFNPNKGFLASLSGELIGSFLGGDQDYYILDLAGTKYWPLFKKHLLETKLHVATSSEFGDSNSVPVFDRFYAGGLGTVRGYNYRRVGPKESGNPVGGQTMKVINLDYNFPIPRLDAFRGVVFVDLGNVNADAYKFFTYTGTVISAGPGIKIKTPFGPVALYYGVPFTNRDSKNRNGRFEFSLSRGF